MSSASIASGSQAGEASLHEPVIPVVAPFDDLDRDGGAGLPLHDDDVLDRWRSLERFVGHLLERDDLPAAIPAVGGHEQSRPAASLMRSRSDSALNPPKTTLCTAPMRAQASMAIASSGISGRYNATRSPRWTPSDFSTLANCADLAVEVPIGQRPPVARFTFPDDRGLVAPRPCARADRGSSRWR